MRSREALERELVARARDCRQMADYARKRAVDRMTFAQYQRFTVGKLRTKSHYILELLEREAKLRREAAWYSHRLNTLLSMEVIDGDKNPYFPSNPIGQLKVVAHA